ncbi:MAG: FtsX-like permease family protein [Actinomycetota bacterium]
MNGLEPSGVRIIGRAVGGYAHRRAHTGAAHHAMATLRFLLKRFVAQRSLGLAVVVTLAFSVGVLVAGPIYADAARSAILSSAIQGAAVTVANARIQAYGGEEFPWADADATITAAARPLPVGSLVRQGLTTVRLNGEDGPSVPLLFRDGAEGHLTFRGEPPGPGEIALAGNSPQTEGVQIGDRVTLVGPGDDVAELTVSGTFLPPDENDPFWFGSRTPFPPPDSSQIQPELVSRDTALSLGGTLGLTTEFSWDLYLDLTDVPFAEVRTIPDRLRQIEDSLHGEPGLAGARVLTGLDTLFRLVDQRVANLRIPILLVVFQIGAVTLAVLAGVGALTLTRQAFELSVLHSRGFSRRTLLFAQGIQAVLAAVVAFPIGLLIGLGLASLAGRSNGPTLPGVLFPVHLNASAQVLGAVTAAIGALILLLLSLPYISRTVLEERRAASREERPLLSRVPVEVIVLPVGIFAFIQLRSGTKPKAGSGTIDPLVLLAPTLLLFAASFLVLRLLLFAFHRMDRRIGRSRRVPIYLAGRKLSRAPGAGFAAALLLLLAMGLLVVSTSYRAIVLRNHQDAAHAIVGADWNVQVSPPDDVLPTIDDMPPNTTPVIRTEPDIGEGTYSLPPTAIAIDPATYPAGGWWRSDFSETPIDQILEALQSSPSGYELPAGASTLSITLEMPKVAEGVGVTATVIDDDGVTHTPETQLAAAGKGTYRIPLAPGTRLLSISFQADTLLDLPFRFPIGIADADIDGTPLPLDGWVPLTWRGSGGRFVSTADGLRFDVQIGAGRVFSGLIPKPAPMPALLSRTVASQVDDTFTVTLGGQQIELRQVAEATQFPSAIPNSPFIVVPARALLERELAVPEPGITLDEVWATGSANPEPALRERGFIVGGELRAAPIEANLAQLPQSLAVGMNFTAAAGGVGLVIIGVSASLYFAQRRRDYEFAALRAMGAERSQIRRTLVLEQGLLLGFAILAGLGLGYLLLRLVMPYVGTSLGVSYPPPLLVMDWTSLGVALGTVAVTTSLGLGLALRTLMRSSVTGVLRGEAE